jgi:hypothetical protein
MTAENMFGKLSFLKRASHSLAKTGFENSDSVEVELLVLRN